MTRSNLAGFAFLCAALGFALSSPTASAQPAKNTQLNIGMVKTFFNDLPAALVDLGGKIFTDSMKTVTGLQGTLTTNEQAFDVAQKLDNGQLQLGVFHGHEFAWVQKKYPQLTPMVMAVNKHLDVRAYIIVHKNNPAKTLADLRGKKIDVPMGTKQHCIVYLERNCTDNAQPNPKAFFGSVVRASRNIVALDDVAAGSTDAVLMDTIGLEFYKSIKGPVFEKNLRVLQHSDCFPSPVIAYKEGGIDNVMLTKIRDGLLKAHDNPAAEDILQMWQIKAFEPIPQTYSKSLADLLKTYPVPEASKVTMR